MGSSADLIILEAEYFVKQQKNYLTNTSLIITILSSWLKVVGSTPAEEGIEQMRNSVEVVARRVEADIRSRGFVAGDRYLTGEELGRMFNVSSITANRAMQLLAERGLLVRQRKAGTFIGEGLELPSNPPRKRVHIVMTSGIWSDDQASAVQYFNQLLCGVLEKLPGSSVQMDVLGPQEINAFIRRIIDSAVTNGDVSGVVLLRSSPEVQRQLVEAGIPTVVFGSVFPGVKGLACVDVDQRQVGRLTAEYLIRAKHSRVMTLMFSQWFPGDNAFISGMMGTLQAMAPDVEIDLQSVPVDEDVCRGVVETAMAGQDRPTAVIARSPWLARIVADVLQSLGFSIPGDVELIMGNHHEVEIGGRRLPGAVPAESMVECGRKLGILIKEIGEHRNTKLPRHELVAVEYHDGKEIQNTSR